jgi:hypothetical protein
MNEIVPYCDLAEAQDYFDDSRLNAESWDDSSSEKQLKALKQATRMIDRLNFKGDKYSIFQANEFPRDYCFNPDFAPIPNDIKIACCEIALALLDGVDPDLEEEDLGAMSEGYSTVRVTSDTNIRKDHIKAGIPSVEAWKHLLPYLKDPLSIFVRRG